MLGSSKRCRQRRLNTALARMRPIGVIVLLLLSQTAAAEVSDKLPSLEQLWATGALVGAAALVAGSYRPLFGILLYCLALVVAYGAHQTLVDPYVGPAALAEQGDAYWWASYGSSFIMFFGAAIGVGLGLRKRTLLGRIRGAR